jgi:sterol desaturase/sphingolipid hydroxylase (fatty acid hydroxylase superfamily)
MASFVISVRRFGRAHFLPIFWSHFLSNIVAMLGGLLLFATLGAVAWALGYRYDSGAALIDHAYNGVLDWLKQHIPTLTILPYPLAIAAGMVFGALPGYFSHWLAHHSRLVWYCGHRGHHSAAILHPVGTGPFMFLPEIFSTLPSVLFAALATKLFYYEPLLFETLVLGALGIVVEKFNHTTVFYDFAFHNPLVRAISAYTGGGVYHYMHHTSRPGDEIVNVGGSPFLIWDRLFGTYRAPTATAPRVGLTNNPQITLSPFAIIFSGWQQIAWELKANTSWSDRWHILFGTVYWSPPLSRDFLIQGYPESAPAKP